MSARRKLRNWIRKLVTPEWKVRIKRKMKRYTPLLYTGYYFFEREQGVDILDTTNKTDRLYERLAHSGLFTLDMPLIVINPYRFAPLTAMIIFTTEEEYGVEATTAGMDGGTDFKGHTEPTRFHRIPVLGLYPKRENKVILSLENPDADRPVTKVYRFSMGDMPKGLHHALDVKQREGASAFPFKLVLGGDTPYPYAIDETGAVRYYIKRKSRSYGLVPLSGGRIWFMEKNNKMVSMPSFSNPVGTRIYEMDWWGRIWNIYQVRYGVHHDVCEKEPGGNIIAASASLEKYTEDAVAEFDRQTGKLVKMVKFEDLLPGLSYCDGIDWVHINSVQYIPEQDAVLVCARNLHSCFLIHWKSGKLKWILGPGTFWKGSGFEKYQIHISSAEGSFYQPHAAEWIGNDRLMIYDNHTNKRHPVKDFDKDRKSYVKVFRLDMENKRADLIQSFPSEKSTIRSNGIWCEKENRMFVMSGYLSRKIEENQGAIYEYDGSGRLINYLETVYSFYRAYEFAPDTVMMGKPLERESQWLCEFEKVERVDQGEIFSAKKLPGKPSGKIQEAEEDDASKRKLRMRKERLGDDWKEKSEEELLQAIRIRRERKCLVVSGYDHSIAAIYLAGDDGVFKVDYSGTKQTMPEFFARFYYGLPFDLQQLKAGTYRVYIRCGKKVYNTGFKVTV